MLELNPAFFGREMQPGGPIAVNVCSTFKNVGDKNIIDAIRRIIVPDGVVGKAEQILKGAGYDTEVVPASKV